MFAKIWPGSPAPTMGPGRKQSGSRSPDAALRRLQFGEAAFLRLITSPDAVSRAFDQPLKGVWRSPGKTRAGSRAGER
jgi:hypothetical protein